jgi:heterodisulfide reductase subunit A
MHEFTFRRTVAEAGLNPYLFEMANIREHCSWCHPGKPEEATQKAKEIVKIAVAKARLLGPLQSIEVPVTNKALVLGGGIAGINAALDLAEMGFKVYLVEKKESIGGHMAQLDKTFPTLDCSICIEGPKMVDVSRHPNIEIFSFTDIIKVEGFVGNFRVKLRKNPRYVIEENCTGCGECRDVCPIEFPNDWDMNLGVRKAISAPFDQAVPLIYTINKDYCIECYKCVDACGDRQAIDFSLEPKEVEVEVGTIIVATGYDIYLPEESNVYGYGKYSNVITSLEFERLILAAGPTEGHVIRASDGKQPKVVALVQCVGSRDVEKYPYCSGFCCMYTLKHAVQLKEHYGKDIEVYVFYIDVRSNFKGYEEFYTRAREMGVNFIRGRVSNVFETPEKNLVIRAEDTLLGEPIELEAEMVVLATAATACKDVGEVSRVLNITRGADGFFMESHPKLKPIDTAVDGIFLAGSCQGPKDIPYSVAQGSGAAARAATILSKSTVKIEPIVSVVDPEKCRNKKVKCGICATKCPYGAIRVQLNEPAEVLAAMCHGCGTCVAECPVDAITQMHFTDAQIFAQIDAALEDNPEGKIMGFCCNWCSYAGADLAGTSRFEYPTNIRIVKVMCSGRVDRDFVLEAFRRGAGMVLVGACHLPYDCHYIDGNQKMKTRMEILANMLQKLGLSPDRFRVEYISAAEGVKFAEVVRDMAAKLNEIGKDKLKAENEKLKPNLDRMLERKSK